MKDHKMMMLLKLLLLVIQKDLYVCTSQRWFQPQITQDSTLSVEYSLVPSVLVIKLEFKVVNTYQEVNTISIKKVFKEPSS